MSDEEEKKDWEKPQWEHYPPCMNCGNELIPRLDSRNPITHQWDKHSFWCRCIGPEIIISVG